MKIRSHSVLKEVWPDLILRKIYQNALSLKQKPIEDIGMCLGTTDEVWIGNWIYWTLTPVTTKNYDNLTPKINVTTAHIKYPQSLVAVAW
jgi:hypothetical protein